ncbi:phage tail assembly protein [Pseudoalteromonas phenolica]|uniref:Phage tail assembly protein n=1 Tax=Pseudoalteromonas phenolica TaxID=161398 RepID=A0A5S3YYC4_9GAMM|nr:phage tail assembly protein [Pseudoalteromonas phenolica]TMN89455.1 phage tail assembly protein [Pseudoalteromonas phenolica]TMP83729.1 phage tail assembly protein [Pseudoalteromonas phenolica]
MTEIIELNYPITVDGHEYAKLTMRRPKVRDRLMVDRADISESESEIRYFSHLCEVSPQVVEELDWSDFVKLREALQAFLVSRPAV